MAIEKGLAETKLMGRFQVVSLENRPQSLVDQVILDGAHTPDSIEALFQNITRLFDNPKLIVVVSLMQDKQITSIGRYICRFADLVITTQPFNNQRVTAAQMLAENWKAFGTEIMSVPDVRKAFQISIESNADLVCVTGSIYLVGEILKKLNISYIDINLKP